MPGIPMDILQEVFEQSWTSPLRAHLPSEFPWYLGHVCSEWRALFFSMRSTFWNSIEIEWHDEFDICLKQQDADNVTEIVHFFLDCTGGVPFSFQLCTTGCHPENETHYNSHPTLVALINCSEQWQNVYIQLYTTELVFLCATKGHLPQLKKLEIVVEQDRELEHQYASRTVPRMVTDIFEDAPVLKEVVLDDFSMWQFKFSWSSLTALGFGFHESGMETLAVLRETINLVELTIERPTVTVLEGELAIERSSSRAFIETLIETSESIHLPHLERLSIDDVALLAVLDTPSLQRLKIDFHHGDSGVATFLRRCGIKLSTLVLYGGRTGIVASLKEILLSAPELDQLVLCNIRDITDLFKWMAGTETPEVRFNSLQLHALYSYWPRDGGGALHDLIARRNPPNNERSLSPKEVFIDIDIDESEVANLKSLCRDRGIRFGLVEEMPIIPWGTDWPWY